VEPADSSCSKAHSRRIPPRLPSDLFSIAANFTSSSLKSGRILIVTVAFHTPMDYVCVYNRMNPQTIEPIEMNVSFVSHLVMPSLLHRTNLRMLV
jgi:hypothetical protein